MGTPQVGLAYASPATGAAQSRRTVIRAPALHQPEDNHNKK